MTANPTPASDLYWPPEWAPHAATWLSWPHNRNTWPGKFAAIPPAYAEFVRAIADFEPVQILAGGATVMADARKHVGDLKNVSLHDIETNDAWIRDHGPTFVVDRARKESLLVDWGYNSWGGKYPPFDKDNAVPARIAERLGRERIETGIVLEGGAIEGNGEGLVMTTPRCLLDSNRNEGMTKERMEAALKEFLGARQVLWIEDGELAGDDTDGHIDQLARFVGPSTVVVASEDDPADENFLPLQAIGRQLREFRSQDGRPLEVIPLPMPRPKFTDGQRMPASYANFLIVNGAVIVPQYADRADEAACEVLAAVFPDRQIIGLPALDLVWGLGAFHCLSQQEPVVNSKDHSAFLRGYSAEDEGLYDDFQTR
jgi:agmatine deiminase